MTEYSLESGEPIADAGDQFPDATNMIPTADQFAHLTLAAIVSSPTNPRKTFDQVKLAELAESIKASGVHQPILVRPLPGSRVEETSWEPRSLKQRAVRPTHEIIAGERRYRAATLAGLSTIPAMIRAMTDDQVLECQLVENLQRDDLSPLEEAEGYEHLCSATSIAKEAIGAKIGRSRTYVYGRLKLLDLSQECKQALREGQIDLSRAEKIARIPDTALQQKALLEATRKGGNGDVISVRDFQTWLQRNVMLRLEGAPFNITDTQLCKEAGSCKECPKRTGAAPDLFADVDGADICTDPPCYQAKEAAHRARLVAKAEAKGMRVIEGKEAVELFRSGGGHCLGGYSRLDQQRGDASDDAPTLRKLLGSNLKDLQAQGVELVLIEHPHTKELIEAASTAEADALLITRGLIKATQTAEKGEREIERLKESIEKRVKKESRGAVWRALVKEVHTPRADDAALITPDLLRAWLITQVQVLDEDSVAAAAGMPLESDYSDDDVRMAVQRLPTSGLWKALAIMLVMDDNLGYYNPNGDDTPQMDALAQALDLDTAAIVKETRATIKAEVAEQIKVLKAQAAPKPAKPLLPLASAAQAEGGGGAKAQSPKTQSPAAPARKKKMSAPEAQAAIAAAMQGQDTDTGAATATQGVEAVSGCALPVGVPAPEADAVDPTLYGQALDLITHEQKASVRRLKAELGIGTDKAMDLMDALEKAGKVSSCDERGARKVLVVA